MAAELSSSHMKCNSGNRAPPFIPPLWGGIVKHLLTHLPDNCQRLPNQRHASVEGRGGIFVSPVVYVRPDDRDLNQ